MPDIEERVESLETLLGRFILHTDMALNRLSKEVGRVSKEVDRVSNNIDKLGEQLAPQMKGQDKKDSRWIENGRKN